MTNKPTPPKIVLVDNPHASDLYADACGGLIYFNGNVRLTLESYRGDHSVQPAAIRKVVIGRVVIPIDAAKHLRDMLVNWFKQEEGRPKSGGPIILQ